VGSDAVVRYNHPWLAPALDDGRQLIKDRPYDRAVEVTVIAPDDMNVLNVQELAGKAGGR
jgi:hypothetical protein